MPGFPLPPHPIPACVVLLAIITASTDIVSRRIPNPIIAAGLVAALLVQGWLHGPLSGSAIWLTGALTGFAVLLPFYLLRGMAAGDVKLLMMIGAWLGAWPTVQIALATFVIGGVWSLALTVHRRRTGQLLGNLLYMVAGGARRGSNAAADQPAPFASVGSLPYGVAIAAGTLGVLFANLT
ncbi:prepilin peptidase CpaA [Paraburkholderia phenazinium]|uniref:Prepilin peptidase CpaA n=2 Tax=Paraburkholderia phenazinium TaxID=60549 RepID=A0A1G8HSL3_9BURK|nr:prepilin peptidase CpaA [Paraburkholderia phenazinium]